MENKLGKTVNLNLVGLNGNAFNLMAQFKRQAQKEGWTLEEITLVLNECMNNDYDHLIATLLTYCDG